MTGLSDLRGIFSNQGSTATAAAPATGKTSSTQTAGVNGTSKAGDTSFQAIDQSALSLTATALSSASAGSDVRMDKVSQLQAAIANGTYSVSSSAVADKLMQSMLER